MASKPGERKLQILQTLATMLEAPRGEKVTTAALAARLDVSEAALYRHFASKAQMFEGLIEFIEQSVFTLINQIAEREPDPGVVRIERGDDDLADVAGGDGFAGAGPHDFEDQVLVHDHAVMGRCLEGDQAEVGGAERLVGIDAARLDLVLQRLRKRGA